MNYFNKIREWAKLKNILDKGNIKTQYIKLQEESGELAEAILTNNKEEIKDAVGDIQLKKQLNQLIVKLKIEKVK